jgi:hypothetical protein
MSMTEAEPASTRRAATARTLAWAALGCIILGLALGSPAGSLFLQAVAVFFALPSVLLARGRARVLSVLVLAVALYFLTILYPEYREHMTRWAGAAR